MGIEIVTPSDRTCLIASLYRTRDDLRQLLGDRYEPVMANFRRILTAYQRRWNLDVLDAGVQLLERSGWLEDDRKPLFILAAMIDLIEGKGTGE